ncbi:MAG TPA: cupin domain-containing protein, partial [Thermohalobaculum sp.]|nr:cupin domain-containing protein [Thermohalobaculum sp.]
MKIRTATDRPTRAGPADYFTGTVWMEPVIEAPDPARANAVIVTFAAGARTFWHTHPLGQTLHVLSGTGRVQPEGGPVRAIRAGDPVWIPPGEKHWHGAAPEHAMTHLAIHERHETQGHVAWLEEVGE